LGDEVNAAVARGGSEGDETYSTRCRARPTVVLSGFAMGSEILSSIPAQLARQLDAESGTLHRESRSKTKIQT